MSHPIKTIHLDIPADWCKYVSSLCPECKRIVSFGARICECGQYLVWKNEPIEKQTLVFKQ